MRVCTDGVSGRIPPKKYLVGWESVIIDYVTQICAAEQLLEIQKDA